MLLHDFVSKSHIGSFWKHALLFENGHDTQGFFNQPQGDGQIHAKIDSGPFDTLFFVLLLLQDKHVVVEELLQLLVGVVDAQLLEGVELENFETGNIEQPNEIVSRQVFSD